MTVTVETSHWTHWTPSNGACAKPQTLPRLLISHSRVRFTFIWNNTLDRSQVMVLKMPLDHRVILMQTLCHFLDTSVWWLLKLWLQPQSMPNQMFEWALPQDLLKAVVIPIACPHFFFPLHFSLIFLYTKFCQLIDSLIVIFFLYTVLGAICWASSQNNFFIICYDKLSWLHCIINCN